MSYENYFLKLYGHTMINKTEGHEMETSVWEQNGENNAKNDNNDTNDNEEPSTLQLCNYLLVYKIKLWTNIQKCKRGVNTFANHTVCPFSECKSFRFSILVIMKFIHIHIIFSPSHYLLQWAFSILPYCFWFEPIRPQ